MRVRTNAFIQAVALAGHLVNSYGGLIPPKYQPVVAGVLGLAQGIVALIGHNFNTNGTPQTMPGGAAAAVANPYAAKTGGGS